MADIASTVCGIKFPNPVMPAAGPNVKTADLMIKAAELGAGAVVSKTFSVIPASDPRPTMKKTVCGGLLNCETWLEDSYQNFLPELKKVKSAVCKENSESRVPFIISIGYSSQDVGFLGKLLEKDIRPDAIEFSTHYTGHNIKPLAEVAEALKKTVNVPVWMKVSPGFPDLEELVKAAEPFVDAFVAVNSYGPALDFNPSLCRKSLGSDWGQGWLSGPPLLPIALGIVCRISRIVKKPVIGVGGISCGIDAVKFIMAGASLVQVCTAAITGGPSVYGKISLEISQWLDSNGYKSLLDIKGKYLDITGLNYEK